MKLFLLGGFLGSGKTTAIQQACLLLQNKFRVGVITNDQGIQLVDSRFIKNLQIPNKEVVDGCFCCNYSELEKAIYSLQEDDTPEILFAEAVGSCTDMVATVIKPLLKFHADLEIVYSVFIDAQKSYQMTGEETLSFDEDVRYIFEKQPEEADILVVNKTDLLSEKQLHDVKRRIEQHYAAKDVLFQNSLLKEDIDNWLSTLLQFEPETERASLQIDYNKYGSGEKKLAWMDEELFIVCTNNNAIERANELVNKIYEKIRRQSYPIGHLKFLISSGQWQKKISFTSLYDPLLKQTRNILAFNTVSLLINARVQTTPQELKQLITESISEMAADGMCRIESKHSSAFQPGFPTPVHRINN